MKVRDKKTYISVAVLAVIVGIIGFNMPTQATHQSIATDPQSPTVTTVDPAATPTPEPVVHQDVIPTGTNGPTSPTAPQPTQTAQVATPPPSATLVSSSKCMVEKQDDRGDTISIADYDYQIDNYSDGTHTVTQYSTAYQNISACPGNIAPN
jgi:hypothetical protein